MKKKELKKMADKILALENIIDANKNPLDVQEAKEQIMKISRNLDPNDMMLIDEMIQEQMVKNS